MSTPDLAKAFASSLSFLIGALVGSAVSHMLGRHRSDSEFMRRELGDAFNQFADVPIERLYSDLRNAAKSVRYGWGGFVSMLLATFWLVAALFSATLYRAAFPGRPFWQSLVICCVVAGLLSWPARKIQRRRILNRLEHIRDATGNA